MTSSGALDGVLVADFSRVLAGPYATMLMADLGAEVVKVEHDERGDDTREWGPPWAGGTSTYYQAVNRNKTATRCDLADAGGRAAALDLCRRADVVVENFRPGAMERLGLGHEVLLQRNPGLVYCSITGFGSRAGRDLPGYDLLVQAVGGLMSITGEEDGVPVKVGVALVDVVAGLHAFGAVLAALRHRDRTGAGQWVEVDLLSSLLSALVNQSSAYLGAGVTPGRMGSRHPSICPYEVVDTSSGYLAVAVGTDRQFQLLCAELGVPALGADPRFSTNADRVANRDALIDLLRPALLSHDAATWAARLTARGVPAGPVNTIPEAFALAGSLGLEPVATLDAGPTDLEGGGSRQVRNPMTLHVTPARYERRPATWSEVVPLSVFVGQRFREESASHLGDDG